MPMPNQYNNDIIHIQNQYNFSIILLSNTPPNIPFWRIKMIPFKTKFTD